NKRPYIVIMLRPSMGCCGCIAIEIGIAIEIENTTRLIPSQALWDGSVLVQEIDVDIVDGTGPGFAVS
ncbi:MAG: hypothetical protein R6V56_07525, partial [Lentisphaeria bacterium]